MTTTTTPFTHALQTDYAARISVWSDIVDHLPTLYGAVAAREAPKVVELGTRSGNSTAAFLAACDASDGHLWSVDIAPVDVPAWWAETGRWTFILGDDLAVVDQTPDQVDVLFIDSSHTYDQTLAELRAYVPRVKPGGVVLLHDTELDGPDPSYIPPGGTVVLFPVARALDTYCAETDREWLNHTGCYGLGQIDIP